MIQLQGMRWGATLRANLGDSLDIAYFQSSVMYLIITKYVYIKYTCIFVNTFIIFSYDMGRIGNEAYYFKGLGCNIIEDWRFIRFINAARISIATHAPDTAHVHRKNRARQINASELAVDLVIFRIQAYTAYNIDEGPIILPIDL